MVTLMRDYITLLTYGISVLSLPAVFAVAAQDVEGAYDNIYFVLWCENMLHCW